MRGRSSPRAVSFDEAGHKDDLAVAEVILPVEDAQVLEVLRLQLAEDALRALDQRRQHPGAGNARRKR